MDFLTELIAKGRINREVVCASLSCKFFTPLIGSAPVGPTTVKNFDEYAKKLPTVRFGSTETCLQVAGTPLYLSDDQLLEAFKRGWDHEFNAVKHTGIRAQQPSRCMTRAPALRLLHRASASPVHGGSMTRRQSRLDPTLTTARPQAKIVRSVDKANRNYMAECAEGEPGQLVCRGNNLMSGYIQTSVANPIHDDGWSL
jgi:acyl-CoA synthetase (AMP-forming)/AMP-acid ligase II